MKRLIASAILALPLLSLGTLSKPASAEPVYLSYNYGHQQRTVERDRREYRDNRRTNISRIREQRHRKWIAARYQIINNHRRWVPGHYVYQ